MQNIGQYIHLIVFLILIAASALGWLSRKVKEQRELRRIELEQQRRRNEALRTGRLDEPEPAPSPMVLTSPPSEAPSPADVKRRLQELADRRRRELEEMRRRAQGQATGAPPREVILSAPSAPPTARPVPAPAPVAPRPVPTARPPQRTTQPSEDVERRRRAAAEKAAREKAQKEAADRQRRQEAAERERRRREQEQREEGESSTTRSRAFVAQAEAEQAAATRAAAAASTSPMMLGLPPIDGPQSAQAWRRAILMMEVMSPPVAVRGDGERVF